MKKNIIILLLAVYLISSFVFLHYYFNFNQQIRITDEAYIMNNGHEIFARYRNPGTIINISPLTETTFIKFTENELQKIIKESEPDSAKIEICPKKLYYYGPDVTLHIYFYLADNNRFRITKIRPDKTNEHLKIPIWYL